MKVSKVCNLTLLQTIAREKEITYKDLKQKYIEPTPKGVVLGKNVMFDEDLNTLEQEGHIERKGDSIIFLRY